MIDIVAPEGTFPGSSEQALLERATASLLKWEKTSTIPIAVANTAAYLHLLPKARVTAGGKADRVVPVGSLKQEQRAGITADITAIVGELAGEPNLRDRTWVLFHEAVDGGWGIAGRAYTNADLGEAVRASLKR
jgi:phenylpyruvate tautomerase PptA (4-oxalocrotonate tautomerase family)